MSRRSALSSPSANPSPRRKWWRGLLGALLTALIIVPYMMGSDVEKYLRGWVDAVNLRNGKFHLELLHYQRHWFTSEGDLTIAGGPLVEKIPVHFKAYHGPLFFNAGHRLRFGLGFFKGTVDSHTVLSQQSVVKMDGPIQLTAFVPYFSDRELHTTLPPIRVTDSENNLVYLFNSVDGNLDGDGLLQLAIPTLTVNQINGRTVLDMEEGLLRILPDSHLASLAVKQINIHFKEGNPATFTNVVLQANTQDNPSPANQVTLEVAVHFDQFKKPLPASPAATFIEVGPFELKLGINGLLHDGLNLLADTLKAVSTQSHDLTPEQGEALEKSLSNIFSPGALFDLTSTLSTPNGTINAQFQGGLHSQAAKASWQNTAELVTAFYSKGTVHLDADVMQVLSHYATRLEQQATTDSNNEAIALPLILSWLKPDAKGNYSTQIDIQDGRIQFNGKAIKDEPS